MAGHVRKKAYQPSISSYFNTRDADHDSMSRSQRISSPLSSPLPADTQASLLSVGMRVRKSVPEGYKTHKTIATVGFPFPSTAASSATAPPQTSYGAASPRELTPFCGLHKIGGWAAQEIPSSSAPAVMTRDEEEAGGPPDLTMSQRTLSFTRSSYMSNGSPQSGVSRKRAYEEEIEEKIEAFFDDAEGEKLIDASMPQADRPIARMKPQLRNTGTDSAVRVVGEDDFEDATFLAPPEGMDLECS